MLARQTPLRPAAAVTGTRASLHTRSTAATSPAVPGRATAAALPPARPCSAPVTPRGPQRGLGQVGGVALGRHRRPVLLDLPGALGVVPAQLASGERGGVVGRRGRVVARQ